MNTVSIPFFPTLSGEIFDSLPESLYSHTRYLETIIRPQQIQIQQQQIRIQELEIRVHQIEACFSEDSSSSNKPPRIDGLKKKTKRPRRKSGKKMGVQKGNVGKGLAQIGASNLIVTRLRSINCQECGLNLSGCF